MALRQVKFRSGKLITLTTHSGKIHMCVYMRVRMCVCVCVCQRVYAQTQMHICMYINKCSHVRMWDRSCACLCIYGGGGVLVQGRDGVMVRVKTGRALLGRDRVEGSKDGRSSFTKTDSFALPEQTSSCSRGAYVWRQRREPDKQ